MRHQSWTAVLHLVLGLTIPSVQAADKTSGDVYGAWSIECQMRAPPTGRTCVATQVVATDPEGKKAVLGVTVNLGEGGSQGIIAIRMSAAAHRPAGAGIKIDDNAPFRSPIGQCDQKLCEVRAWLNEDVLSQMRAGKLLLFAFFVDEKSQVTFPVSLEGFDEAFQALQSSPSTQ
jgi:invasion protein IalB